MNTVWKKRPLYRQRHALPLQHGEGHSGARSGVVIDGDLVQPARYMLLGAGTLQCEVSLWALRVPSYRLGPWDVMISEARNFCHPPLTPSVAAVAPLSGFSLFLFLLSNPFLVLAVSSLVKPNPIEPSVHAVLVSGRADSNR